MKKFKITCTCGDDMFVDAADQPAAVEAFKAMMTQEAVNAHFAEKHAGQPVPSMDEVAAMCATATEVMETPAPETPAAPAAPVDSTPQM